MYRIGAALGDKCDLCAGRAPQVRAGICGDGAEFLDRIERHPQNAAEGAAVLLVVDVYAVERNVGLIGFSAVHRAAAVIVESAGIRFSQEDDARLQRKQAHHIACLEWQLRDDITADSIAERGVGGVHLHGFRGHRNDLGDGAQLFKRYVDGRRRVHQ